jgi:hypothetical protein
MTRFISIRDQARKQNLKVQQIIKVYKQNSLAGQKFSFEYKRYVVGQIKYRDELFAMCD